MSPKTKKFSDLAAPIYADPRRRARVENEKREILTGLRPHEAPDRAGAHPLQLVEGMGMTQKNVCRIKRAEDTRR